MRSVEGHREAKEDGWNEQNGRSEGSIRKLKKVVMGSQVRWRRGGEGEGRDG